MFNILWCNVYSIDNGIDNSQIDRKTNNGSNNYGTMYCNINTYNNLLQQCEVYLEDLFLEIHWYTIYFDGNHLKAKYKFSELYYTVMQFTKMISSKTVWTGPVPV